MPNINHERSRLARRISIQLHQHHIRLHALMEAHLRRQLPALC